MDPVSASPPPPASVPAPGSPGLRTPARRSQPQALIVGVSRTMLGMARAGDLPRPLAHMKERFSAPQRAELVVVIAVVAMVLLASDNCSCSTTRSGGS